MPSSLVPSVPCGATPARSCPAWHNPALVDVVINRLVASAEPAVTFTSLADAGAPVLADECVVVVAEEPAPGEPGHAPFTIRHPTSGPATARSHPDWPSITATVDVAAGGGEPAARVAATFVWHGACRIEDVDQVVADLLVQRAADVVARERLLVEQEQARDKAENLGRALESNRQIGQAIGILMATGKVTEHQAFDLLREVSQRTHRKLRDVADDVCRTGALDDARPRLTG